MKFSPRPLPTVVCLLLFVAMILLGFWQWTRYHQKQSILSRFHAATAAKPMAFAKFLALSDKAYRHVTLVGRFLSQQSFLLQHRYHNGKLGFEVLTPVKLNSSKTLLLVNRGWIPATKQLIPAIRLNVINGQQKLNGYVLYPPHDAFMLGDNIVDAKHWPLQIQKIDFAEMQSLLNHPIYPFVVYLDKKSPHGFVRDWEPVNVNPKKHLGYMVQWFMMALALLIAYFAFSCKRGA